MRGFGYKYLSDHLRWFCIVYGLEILLHRSVIVLFLVQVVSIFAINHILVCWVYSQLLGEVDCQDVQIPLIQEFQFLLKRLFMIAEDLEILVYGTCMSLRSYFAIQGIYK